MKPIRFISLIFFSAAVCAAQGGPEQIVKLCVARLQLAEPVARAKWGHDGAGDAAIQDRAREATVIQSVKQLSKPLALDENYVAAVFNDQIEANKQLQASIMQHWREDGGPGEGTIPDLARDVRPKIDLLNRQIVATLAENAPLLHQPDCEETLGQLIALEPAVDDVFRASLKLALAHVCRP
ncbi:gamma subclass chorismate mutase AroQ [Andreprevotia chitinilytica]|uniref:gamma subclass chorismate mutase AroQ n=1 Tax=Andreprevotia chitinilytica TaxID=396808 RepID=UPI00068ACB22|nr:gamma subclass chorismate mutase AroQ [Andreprevotia chitinilytica]